MTSKHITAGLFITFLLSLAIAVPTVFADDCSGGQYGGTCPEDLNVNKQVRNPITGVYVENLLSGDDKYSFGSEVVYLLKIYNNGTQTFETVRVTDTLPNNLTEGKVDEPDKNKVKNESFVGQVLSFDISDLISGETEEIHVKAKVKTIPADPCDVNNKALVESEGRSDQDTAKLCVTTEKGKLPEAGPADYLPLLPFMLMGIIGTALIVRSKGLQP